MGLICNAQGCQIGVEVYTGNTKDETTVMDKVHEIKARYGIDRVIFVGDHGMIRRSNIEALKDEEDLHTIGALARAEMMTLLKEKVIDRELSDERSIHEVADAANPTRLYCLWRNPQKAQRERKTRQRLLDHRNRPGQDRGLSYVWCGQGVRLRWSFRRPTDASEADVRTGLTAGEGGLRVDKA